MAKLNMISRVEGPTGDENAGLAITTAEPKPVIPMGSLDSDFQDKINKLYEYIISRNN